MDWYNQPDTGFSPSVTSCSKELGPVTKPKMPLQITTRTPKTPDFKFELLPLHSQLLRQSLLVSFPPLIDMLKFSGYPYLIRGQKLRMGGLRQQRSRFHYENKLLRFGCVALRHCISQRKLTPPVQDQPMINQRLRFLMTLEQACLPEYQKAQCAFKDSMIH